MKPYYRVIRLGDRAPTVQHPTLDSAVKESLRLAKQHPGCVFEVLKCVAISQTSEANTFWMDGEEPHESEPEWRYFLDTPNIIRDHQLYCRERNGITEWANIRFPDWEEINQSVSLTRTEIHASELPPEIKP